MNKSILTAIALAAGALVWFLPGRSLAATATLDSMSPSMTDVTDIYFGGGPSFASIHAYDSSAVATDTDVTVVYSVDETPIGVLTLGGKLSDGSNAWSYDATTGKVTFTFNYTGPLTLPDGSEIPVIFLAIIFADTTGMGGPPAEAAGMWMSTNVGEWTMTPPQEANGYKFGFELTGPDGFEGYFKMFIPQGLIDYMGALQGKELTVADLAVFIDDEQTSFEVVPAEGGALININVTFSASSASSVRAAASVTKTITAGAGEVEPITLEAKKSTVQKGNLAKLFGNLGTGKSGKLIEIWRKIGDGKYIQIACVLTEEDGYYEFFFKPKKTAKYKAIFKDFKSDPVQIKVTQ